MKGALQIPRAKQGRRLPPNRQGRVTFVIAGHFPSSRLARRVLVSPGRCIKKIAELIERLDDREEHT